MTLIIEIKNKRAKHIPADGEGLYVCGNSGNRVSFVFDDEFSAITRTARFIANNKYYDVEFEGNLVEIPVFEDAKYFDVGVYVGEPAKGEDSLASTTARIYCDISVRALGGQASDETGVNYTNEARRYAEEAKQAVSAAAEILKDKANATLVIWEDGD